jgi:predicted lipoprotein with Yx(FWY)xxD motif
MRRTALAVTLALTVVASASAGPSKAVVVKAAYNKELKETILVDGAGRTLYLDTADYPRNTSSCVAIGQGCPQIWPALRPPATAGTGVKASLLGTTVDGKQVSYNGHPLYYFHGGHGLGAPDTKAGQVNGFAVYQVWWAVSPKGTAIKK